jgi:hypothetical protein
MYSRLPNHSTAEYSENFIWEFIVGFSAAKCSDKVSTVKYSRKIYFTPHSAAKFDSAVHNAS